MDFIRFRLETNLEAGDKACAAVRIASRPPFNDPSGEHVPPVGNGFEIWQTHPIRLVGYEGLAQYDEKMKAWRIVQA